MNDKERLTFELERFGHFTIEEGGRWTQAEIDAEWARQYAAKLVNAPTERSPAFVLNQDFKSEPEPEYHVVSDEEVDEQDLLLPFVYKPDPNNQIDWDAIRAQPRIRVEDSPAYKTALVNLKKKKYEEDLEVDTEAIKNKYQALKGKVFPFSIFHFFILINLFYHLQIPYPTSGSTGTARKAALNAMHSMKNARERESQPSPEPMLVTVKITWPNAIIKSISAAINTMTFFMLILTLSRKRSINLLNAIVTCYQNISAGN